MYKYADFDAMMAEVRREEITLKVFGREYSFPAAIPAYIPLELSKYNAEDAVPHAVLLSAARVMFGEALDDWAQHPEFTLDELSLLLKTAFELIAPPIIEGAITEDDVQGAKKK